MKVTFTIILLLICAGGFIHAEGIGDASFKNDCYPQIGKNVALMQVLAGFDILDAGRSQAIPDQGKRIRDFPFVFAARIHGTTGPYTFLLVIDYTSSLGDMQNQIISGRIGEAAEHDTSIALALWPRDPTKHDWVDAELQNHSAK